MGRNGKNKKQEDGNLNPKISKIPLNTNGLNTTNRQRLWHIYTMEYYSAIKRNEIELFVLRWMNLESVIQSEVSQKEKTNITC